jgi:hypothetical protein
MIQLEEGGGPSGLAHSAGQYHHSRHRLYRSEIAAWTS